MVIRKAPASSHPYLQNRLVICTAAGLDLDVSGFAATEGIVRLVKPSCFTAEELDLIALDLPVNDKRVEDWVRETGGVNGLARGIYADFLVPLARLAEAFQRETGLVHLR